MKKKIEAIDIAVTFLIIKKLMTPVNKTKAYELGLVNTAGKIIKVAKTDKEKDALTILDKFIFTLKRLLGTKLTQLNDFTYIQTVNTNVYNQLNPVGNIEKRAEIKRIAMEVNKLQEKYECNIDYILEAVVDEQMRILEGE